MNTLFVSAVGYTALLILAGHLLPLLRRRLAGSIAAILVIVSLIFSIIITRTEPPLVRMVVIVSLQLLSMKVCVNVVSSSGQGNRLRFIQWLAFAIGWFGMRPGLFTKLPQPSLPHRHFFVKGISRMAVGIMLLYFSCIPVLGNLFFLSDLLLLAGLSLILHFGILNLFAGIWRAVGVPVSELFPSPYLSRSLKEFWGKRWNVAFSEMTALIIYRPLKTTVGIRPAMFMSFLFSGLLHEIALSLPVRTGFGLPLLYFGLQALLMRIEEQPTVKRIMGRDVVCNFWVLGCLIVPLPLLFHPTFVQQVLAPIRTCILATLLTKI